MLEYPPYANDVYVTNRNEQELTTAYWQLEEEKDTETECKRNENKMYDKLRM